MAMKNQSFNEIIDKLIDEYKRTHPEASWFEAWEACHPVAAKLNNDMLTRANPKT